MNTLYKKEDLSNALVYEEYSVNLLSEIDNEIVVTVTRSMAERAGFKPADEAMIAASASELSTNIIRYAKQGFIAVKMIAHPSILGKMGIEIEAKDEGPGIGDLALAFKENYSTTFGSLGMGLPSVLNYMDEMAIESGSKTGTHIIARKWG